MQVCDMHVQIQSFMFTETAQCWSVVTDALTMAGALAQGVTSTAQQLRLVPAAAQTAPQRLCNDMLPC
jgi:hypothetical protein